MAFRVWLLFALLSVCCGQTAAQITRIDSLESLVKSLPSDTNKVWMLNSLVSQLREKDNNKAFTYASTAKDLAELLRYKNGLAVSLEHLAWVLYRRGDFAQSFDLSTQALKVNEELNDRSAMARCLINIAAINFEQKQYDLAISNFKQAYAIAEDVPDKATMARSLNNIAYSFERLNAIDSAHSYVRSALVLSKQLPDRYMTAFAMRTLGDVYKARKQYLEAIESFKQCLLIATEESNTFLKVSTLHRLGSVYKDMGNYQQAIKYMEENIQIAEKYAYKEELERTYKSLAETYERKKDINRAFEYQSKYLLIHDSLYSQKQSEQLALLQTRYDAKIKQAEIDLLTKEAELNEEEIRSQKTWLYFSIGCLSLLVILAFVLFYNNRYNSIAKRELQEKNKAINNQTQQLKNLNATKDKLFSIISHDLRSPLASLRALMELVGTPGLTQEEFVNITRILKRNLDTVHEDLDNLLMWAQTQLKGIQAMPEPLEMRSLADEKIRLFKDLADSKKVTISNEIKPGTLAFADKNHIGLVLRNLIANAIKFNHTGGHIAIAATDTDGAYEVSVIDSGVGISEEDVSRLFNAETHFTRPGTNKEKGVGIGLLITKEFVENNNGSIWVTSELGKGTRFTFTVKAIGAEVPA